MQVQAQIVQSQNSCTAKTSLNPTGQELETVVVGSVLADLNQQLADVSNAMKRQLEEKQAIRAEMESIYNLKTNPPLQVIDGIGFVDLSPEAAQLLGVSGTATPISPETGDLVYRLREEDFQVAAKAALGLREGSLEGLNSDGELTMLKIQSLVDQRKNALTLLSNLLAAGNEIAKTIIGNIRG